MICAFKKSKNKTRDDIVKNLLKLACAALALVAMTAARAGTISDAGVAAYWGSDDHGYGDVIGASTYDIKGATITRVGSVLTIAIATSFAGHAGSDAAQAPGGIGYGDVFLAQAWNPYGTDNHHVNDNAANGTHWSYGLNLDNRFSNTGGTFKLYKLNGAYNSQNIRNSETFMSCRLGTDCYYRNGQAAAVKTTSSNVFNTGLTGTWSVTANQMISLSINVATTDLANFSAFALHWGETCGNDVIEGIASADVPVPGSASLLALGLAALAVMRRRRAAPARAA